MGEERNTTQKLKNTAQECNTNTLQRTNTRTPHKNATRTRFKESTQELADLALKLLRDVSRMCRIEATAFGALGFLFFASQGKGCLLYIAPITREKLGT
jgi:hypothetical protein